MDVSSLPYTFDHPYNDKRDATLRFYVTTSTLNFQQIVNGNGRSGYVAWPDMTSGAYNLTLYFNGGFYTLVPIVVTFFN